MVRSNSVQFGGFLPQRRQLRPRQCLRDGTRPEVADVVVTKSVPTPAKHTRAHRTHTHASFLVTTVAHSMATTVHCSVRRAPTGLFGGRVAHSRNIGQLGLGKHVGDSDRPHVADVVVVKPARWIVRDLPATLHTTFPTCTPTRLNTA